MTRKLIVTAALVSALAATAAQANTAYPNLLGKAEAEGNFKTFLSAVKAAGLTETLAGTENYTVFAPTDAAFSKLPPGTLDRLMKPENKQELTKLLQRHIVPGKVFASTWANETAELTTKSGAKITIDGSNVPFKAGGANVTSMNVNASNGKIHAIDQVITN